MKEIIEQLRKLNACEKSLDWLAEQPDPKTAWETCEKGSDLLWLCARLSGAPKSQARLKLMRVLNECITTTAYATDADAAYTANAVAYADAAAHAAYAANAAADLAAYAAVNAAVASMRKQADIVRKHYSYDEILEQLKGVKI
jgi:hypothetical protein